MPFYFYNESMEQEWDAFVLKRSVNGNFLQTRDFLNYHPAERFRDCSLIYNDTKGNLRAVIPAASMPSAKSDLPSFVSHPGSTYGGIVVDEKSCCARRIQRIIDELVEFLKGSYSSIGLRFPPSFLWVNDESQLLEYLLKLNGFKEKTELTTYISFSSYKEKTLSNFTQGKRTCINHGLKKGFKLKKLTTPLQIEKFYELLCGNLKKFNAKPAHTLSELKILCLERLRETTETFGVYDGDNLVAAGWVFLFLNQHAAHTQYLCAVPDYGKYSPMTFLYYSLIEYYGQDENTEYLSWGISTENCGEILNWGLTESKESYGSLHDVHRRFLIDIA